MRQPAARAARRVPRSPLDSFFRKGTPSDAVRYAAGTVTDTDTDTLTADIHGEEVPKIAVLGDMPDVGDQVDIWTTGDLLFVPAYSRGLVIVHHGTDGSVARPAAEWVLWLGTATPAHAKPYDAWEEANI